MMYFLKESISFLLFCAATAAATDGIMEVMFSKHKDVSYDNSLWKRNQNSLALNLKNEQIFYAADLSVGTPPQNLTVLLDTGSSDLWVTGSDNPYCLSNEITTDPSKNIMKSVVDCSRYGTFEKDNSSTFSQSDSRFQIKYADNTFANGYWAKDVVSLGDNYIADMQFAVANETNSTVGVLGIGFERLESVKGYEGAPNTYYQNFPLALKNNGIIDKTAYSLHLNSLDSSSGSILFGGIDSNKYTGDLYTFPLVNIHPSVVNKPAKFHVTVQGIGVQSSGSHEQSILMSTKYPALLDSGTTLLVAPQEFADSMANYVNATYNDLEGIYTMTCPPENDDTEFLFDFGDLKIKVPLKNFILAPEDNEYCGFGVLPTVDTMILGDMFLSAAYVVYDLESYEVSLAQANWNSDESEIQAIRHTVPGATKATAATWSPHETTATISYSQSATLSSYDSVTTEYTEVTQSTQLAADCSRPNSWPLKFRKKKSDKSEDNCSFETASSDSWMPSVNIDIDFNKAIVSDNAAGTNGVNKHLLNLLFMLFIPILF